ncbi:unnamed protein product [Paramecium pentaurelia]|uniref:Uncharacterized protein n=1 Tax=Paramecium pentaurelia TaxID=43138 RepID=A0A8S1UDA9_9CILI|nr:unnamed protein product [Paramecium pentaurelia]
MKALLQQTMQQIKLDQELKKLLAHRSDSQDILMKLQSIFEQALDDHTELYWKKEHAHTKTQLECSIQECIALRHDLREMDEDRTEKQNIIKEQNKQIDELQEALEEIEQKLNIMQENVLQQKQELAEEFEQNLNQIQDSYKLKEQEQFQNLQQKLTELEQIVSDQQVALTKERELQQHVVKDYKQVKAQLKTEQETVTQLRQQIQSMKKTNETLNIDKQCLENRSKQQKQQNETQYKQIKSLETKLIDITEELERYKKKNQQDQANLKTQQNDQEKIYKRKLRNYKLKVDEIKNKIKQNLQKIFSSLKLDMETFRLQILKELQLVSTQTCQIVSKQLKLDYDSTQREFSDKMEQIRYSMQAHFKNTLEKQIQEFESKEMQMKNEYELIIKTLKSQIQGLEDVQKDLEREIQQKQTETQENQLNLQEKIELLIEQQKQLDELSNQAKDQLNLLMEQEEQIKELKEQNEKYTRKTIQYEDYVSKQAILYQTQKAEEKMYKKQYEDVAESNQHLKKQIKILQEQLQSDQFAINKLKTQVSSAKLNNIKDVEERHLIRLQNIRKI